MIIPLVPLATAVGWFVGRRTRYWRLPTLSNVIPSNYFVGLTHIINDEPDAAVDVLIKLVEVDNDSMEIHLALGSLFRRRGEVDRAIRIHQNIIARPNLASAQRVQALSELGQDYLKAGVLDRAERIFEELVGLGEQLPRNLRFLLNIYQKEKDWQKAIKVASQLAGLDSNIKAAMIAHFYCELAEIAYGKQDIDTAYRQLKRALSMDRNCVRASLLSGEYALAVGNYRAAVKSFRQVKQQDPDYLCEAVSQIVLCYRALGDFRRCFDFLWECLAEYPRVSVILALTQMIEQRDGIDMATQFLSEQLAKYPSLRGLEKLAHFYLLQAEGETRSSLHLLHQLLAQVLKQKPFYRCMNCGFSASQLYWHCPGCRNWNTVRPIHGIEGDGHLMN